LVTVKAAKSREPLSSELLWGFQGQAAKNVVNYNVGVKGKPITLKLSQILRIRLSKQLSKMPLQEFFLLRLMIFKQKPPELQ
jgi:hypothetical protein